MLGGCVSFGMWGCAVKVSDVIRAAARLLSSYPWSDLRGGGIPYHPDLRTVCCTLVLYTIVLLACLLG